MSDTVRDHLNHSVLELSDGPTSAFFLSLRSLSEFPPEEVLTELFSQVNEAADAADVDAVSATPLMPNVDIVRTIVDAVRADDFSRMSSVVGDGYPNLVTALLATIFALRESARSI